MKSVGIIGGIGPESTIEYYRFIIEGYRARITDGTYPAIIINSIDISKLVGWMEASNLSAVTDYLLGAIEKLDATQVDFVAIAANTPHIVFNEVRARSPLPMVSIVEATRDKARALGLRRVGLLGTGFTMRSRFYHDAFAAQQMEIIVPNSDEQEYVHEKYFAELVRNIILPETRTRLLAIVNRMKSEDAIDGLILGGTELPLILRDSGNDQLPFLDTTRIHVDAIVEKLLS